MNWFITNLSVKAEDDTLFHSNIDTRIYIEGYIVPRLGVFKKYNHFSESQLVETLFADYQFDFIKYIKGAFTLILFVDNNFYIYSDRHSLKKYFVWQVGAKFFISNSLDTMKTHCDLKISKEDVAVFSLTSHFIGSNTAFQNVRMNTPAQRTFLNGKELINESYWRPQDVFSKSVTYSDINTVSQHWSDIVTSYIEFLKPENISLTITGGNDSRMILAALLFKNIDVHTFTFGNPLSFDGFIVDKLKKTIYLKHDYYFVEEPTIEWFKERAIELIDFGNGLINIHRAHRLHAIMQEKRKYQSDMLFTGLVGGEYFKETFYDDTTIPKIFHELQEQKAKPEQLQIIRDRLLKSGFKIECLDIEKVRSKLFDFLKNGEGYSEKQKKFIYTYLFYGCCHHIQDANIFLEHVKYVVNPFMDIDFVEIIALQPQWYVNRKVNFFNRFFHSRFYIEVTDKLVPQLAHVPFAKKGMYTSHDLLKNPFLYIIKRLFYYISRDQNKFAESFPMGEWLYEYCIEQLSDLSPEVQSLFNEDQLRLFLENNKGKTTEKSWHTVTNVINLDLITKHFSSKKEIF